MNTELVIFFFFGIVRVNVFKVLVILEKITSEVEHGPRNDFLLDGKANVEINGKCGSVLV